MHRACFVVLIAAALAGVFISCSDSPVQPNAAPTPAPAPPATPVPNAGPTPKARPIPPPVPANHNPVAKLSIQIESVYCDGVQQKSNTSFDVVKVGCKMYFDTTPKDAGNNRTTPEGLPEWSFDPGNLVSVNLQDLFTPIVTADNDGVLIVYSTVDGIRSKNVEVKLVD